MGSIRQLDRSPQQFLLDSDLKSDICVPASKIVYDRNEILTVVEKRRERVECRPGRRGRHAVNWGTPSPGCRSSARTPTKARSRSQRHRFSINSARNKNNKFIAGRSVYKTSGGALRLRRLRARTRGQSACLSSPGIPFGPSFSILAAERVQSPLMAPDGRGDKNAEFAVIGERHIAAERRLIACRISVRAVFFRWKTELLVPNGGPRISYLRWKRLATCLETLSNLFISYERCQCRGYMAASVRNSNCHHRQASGFQNVMQRILSFQLVCFILVWNTQLYSSILLLHILSFQYISVRASDATEVASKHSTFFTLLNFLHNVTDLYILQVMIYLTCEQIFPNV